MCIGFGMGPGNDRYLPMKEKKTHFVVLKVVCVGFGMNSYTYTVVEGYYLVNKNMGSVVVLD